MKINLNNFESRVIDYYDENLSADEVAELFLFLEQHPELKDEFHLFENIRLNEISDENHTYPGKIDLFKSDELSEKNMHEWFIAEVEGQLSAEQSLQLEKFMITHPAYIRERELFQSTKLFAHNQERYEGKDALKKTSALSADSIQEWLIAELEGELNLQQRSQLLSFLKNNPAFEKDRELYRNTLLRVDKSEKFPEKQRLYKRLPASGFDYKRAMRIAALLMLLIGAALLFRLIEKEHHPDPRFASVEDTRVKPESAKEEIQNAPALVHLADKRNQPDQENENIVPDIKDKNAAAVQRNSSKTNRHLLPAIKNPGSNALRPGKNEMALQNKQPAKRHVTDKNSTVVTAEMIAELDVRPSPLLNIEEPFVFAERRYTPKATVSYENPDEPPSLAGIINPSRISGEMINMAVKNVNKAAGAELLGSASQPAKLPFGSRLLKLAAKAVGKISNDKVKVRTAFNPITGKLSAYEVETEKRVIQKQF